MPFVCTAALAATLLLPCTPPDTAVAQSYGEQTVKKKKMKAVRPTPRVYSPSGNPEWDVYVKGAYIGSDPDPRIRWTLAKEARGSYNLK